MFLAGMCTIQEQEISEKFQFLLGNLPVKYLGVSLSSKRIIAVDCDILVDRMTETIRSWHAKYLTYVAPIGEFCAHEHF